MSVLDNVVCARQLHEQARSAEHPVLLALLPAHREAACAGGARAACGSSTWRSVPRAPATSLPYGDQRRLEIVRALALKPSLLLLDEPTAGMNARESMFVLDLIRRIRDQYRLTIIIVEHNMPLVMQLCERIQVLNYGQIIAEGTPEQVRSDPRVDRVLPGKGSTEMLAQARDARARQGRGQLRRTSRPCTASDLRGRATASWWPCWAPTAPASRRPSWPSPGSCGRARAPSPTTASTSRGRARSTSSTWASSTAPRAGAFSASLTVLENLRMGAVRRQGQGSGARATWTASSPCFPCWPSAADQSGATLSGGEQQMLAIGRALMGQPRLLMLDEPSLGLAPIVVEAIFEVIRELHRGGSRSCWWSRTCARRLPWRTAAYVLETGSVMLSGRGAAARQPGNRAGVPQHAPPGGVPQGQAP